MSNNKENGDHTRYKEGVSGRVPTARVRAILFDKDGTLFDFRKTWLPLLLKGAKNTAKNDERLAKELIRAGGYDPDTDRFAADGPIAAGNAEDMAEAWQDVLLRNGWQRSPEGRGAHPGNDRANAKSSDSVPVIPSKSDLIYEINRVSLESGVTSSVPVTNLRSLFERLSASGLRLGLATSDTTESARAALEREGIVEFFSYVAGYDSPAGTKPSPKVARAFYEPLNIPAGEVMVVGDTWHDMEMARRCGCIAVAVLTGAVEREELQHWADIVLESIADLPQILDAQ